MFLYGKDVANHLKERVKKKVENLNKNGQFPKIAIVQLVDDPALNSFFKSREKTAQEVGILIELKQLFNGSFEDIKNLINSLNNDDAIWGIIIDTPYPKEFSAQQIISLINPDKDVEGKTWSMLERLKRNIQIPVAQSVIETLDFYNIPIENKKVVCVGKSPNVGKPIIDLFLLRGAYVRLCDSRTIDVPSITKEAEILVVAMNKMKHVTKEFVNENQVLFDVGCHYDENGKLSGDVDPECYDICSQVCPSPKGVGPITAILVFENLLKLRGIF